MIDLGAPTFEAVSINGADQIVGQSSPNGVGGFLWQNGTLNTTLMPPPFQTLFRYFNGHDRTLTVRGQAMSASTEYVTGEYFRGLAVSPAAGRL